MQQQQQMDGSRQVVLLGGSARTQTRTPMCCLLKAPVPIQGA